MAVLGFEPPTAGCVLSLHDRGGFTARSPVPGSASSVEPWLTPVKTLSVGSRCQPPGAWRWNPPGLGMVGRRVLPWGRWHLRLGESYVEKNIADTMDCLCEGIGETRAFGLCAVFPAVSQPQVHSRCLIIFANWISEWMNNVPGRTQGGWREGGGGRSIHSSCFIHQ